MKKKESSKIFSFKTLKSNWQALRLSREFSPQTKLPVKLLVTHSHFCHCRLSFCQRRRLRLWRDQIVPVIRRSEWQLNSVILRLNWYFESIKASLSKLFRISDFEMFLMIGRWRCWLMFACVHSNWGGWWIN